MWIYFLFQEVSLLLLSLCFLATSSLLSLHFFDKLLTCQMVFLDSFPDSPLTETIGTARKVGGEFGEFYHMKDVIGRKTLLHEGAEHNFLTHLHVDSTRCNKAAATRHH